MGELLDMLVIMSNFELNKNDKNIILNTEKFKQSRVQRHILVISNAMIIQEKQY